MTLDELKRALDLIPADGGLNKAKRRALVIAINKLKAGGASEHSGTR